MNFLRLNLAVAVKVWKETKKLKTYLGRVTRDINRKLVETDAEFEDLFYLSERLLAQKRDDKTIYTAFMLRKLNVLQKVKFISVMSLAIK